MKIFKVLLFIFLCILTSSCATIQEVEMDANDSYVHDDHVHGGYDEGVVSNTVEFITPIESIKIVPIVRHTTHPRVGVYHKMNEGETLWRIAKTYNVTVDDLVRENSIPDVAQLETNQLIFVPGAIEIRHILQEGDIYSKEFMWPIKGKIVHYFNKPVSGRINRGIDIKAKPGDEIVAARTGKVVFADFLTGFGHTIILDHDDDYYSLYGNNAELLVQLGDSVIKRSPIALIGRIGGLPSVAHFEIRKQDKPINPLHYLPRK